MTRPETAALFSLHGIALRLRSECGYIAAPLRHLLESFRAVGGASAAGAVHGTIRPYQEKEVLRRLPTTAARLSPPQELTEIYQLDERYWLIDDRWGLAEINLLKGEFRSWILPQPTIDAERTVEFAVLWPLVQLLRGKGLVLVPAASAVRDGWGVLMLSQAPIEPELSAMIRAGYRIVGQRWTALREQNGRVVMLHMPGKVERLPAPAPAGRAALPAPPVWCDLTAESCGSTEPHAACDAVVLIDRGQRPVAHLKSLPRTNARVALRRSWPVAQLHAQRKLTQLHSRLARHSRCFEARLSREPRDFLKLLDEMRYHRVPSVEATVHIKPADQRIVA